MKNYKIKGNESYADIIILIKWQFIEKSWFRFRLWIYESINFIERKGVLYLKW